MTDANGVTVSNGYADNNAPYDVATKTIANKRFQKVILYDGSGNEVTSWTITPSGTQDINLKQVGGVATSLGQKALADGIPVSISFDQIKQLTDIDSVPAGGIVSLFYDESGYFQPSTLDAFGRGLQVAAFALDGAGNSIASATTTPGASDRGYVVRNIPSGTQNIAITAVSATVPAYGKIAGSSLTTSYQTVLTMGGAGKILQIWNSTEVPVIFSYDGGTTANLELGPYESESVDYAANGMTLASGTIQAKLVSGSAPVNGGSVRAKVTR